MKSETFFNVERDPNVRLSNFTFENLDIKAKKTDIDKSIVNGITLKNVRLNKKLVE
jgi:hypothetical protein